MSTKEYIKKELELMKVECERYQISPEEWIKQNAVKYHELNASKVVA